MKRGGDRRSGCADEQPYGPKIPNPERSNKRVEYSMNERENAAGYLKPARQQ